MTRDRSAQLTLILSIVAAALALGAAAIQYAADGELRWGLIGAGLFLLAFGFGAKYRLSSP